MSRTEQLACARRDGNAATDRRDYHYEQREGRAKDTGTMMSQLETIHRPYDPRHDDEDDVLDQWLASLQVSEFEYILNRLAADEAEVLTAAAG
jgi:hypothetical protein